MDAVLVMLDLDALYPVGLSRSASKKARGWTGADDFRSEGEDPNAASAFLAEARVTHAASQEHGRGGAPMSASEESVAAGCVPSVVRPTF